MKITLFFSAVKTPFDSEYHLRVSNENHTADETMQEKKLGSFEVDIPSDVENAMAELLIDNIEDLILEAHKNHTARIKNLSDKLNFLNAKLAQ
jgi:hypothetical protein